MILDCCRTIRIFSCPMTNWRKNHPFHLPAHRANVIIVGKVKCVQFTLKPLHYLTVTSHICSQDQHHNFLQRHNYIYIFYLKYQIILVFKIILHFHCSFTLLCITNVSPGELFSGLLCSCCRINCSQADWNQNNIDYPQACIADQFSDSH